METPWRIINYKYAISPTPLGTWDWSTSNALVSYDDGYRKLERDIPGIALKLGTDPSSRQVIQICNKGEEYMSCLISIQWLIDDGLLHCIASYRSQHATLGRPSDTKLIQHLYSQMISLLDDCKSTYIKVNVGDYHYYDVEQKVEWI